MEHRDAVHRSSSTKIPFWPGLFPPSRGLRTPTSAVKNLARDQVGLVSPSRTQASATDLRVLEAVELRRERTPGWEPVIGGLAASFGVGGPSHSTQIQPESRPLSPHERPQPFSSPGQASAGKPLFRRLLELEPPLVKPAERPASGLHAAGKTAVLYQSSPDPENPALPN